MDAVDSEVAGQLDLRNIFNCGVEGLWVAVSADVGEIIRRLDGVFSGARSSEVVCSGDW